MPFGAIQAAFVVIGTIIGTNYHETFGMKQGNEKKPYQFAVLRNRDGDLKKEWYVEWYVWHSPTEKLVRKRIKINQSFRDKKSRTDEGNLLIEKINRLLRKGFHFTNKIEEEIPIIPSSAPEDPKKNILITSLDFALSVSKSSLKPKTIITYQSAINKLDNYTGKNISSFEQFTVKEAIEFRDHLNIVLKNSPRTCNNTIQHLNALFEKLIERKRATINPFSMKGVKEPATNKNIAFTAEDQLAVEKYMIEHEPQLYLFTRFLYCAFVRPGELLQLKIANIHLQERYISIHGLTSKSGRTESAQIIKSLYIDIKNSIPLENGRLYIFGKGLVPNSAVSAKQVAFIRHKKVLKALGLQDKGYTLYSWKHTGACNAYLSGVGLKELQALLRHTTLHVTDIYLKSLGLRTNPKIGEYSW